MVGEELKNYLSNSPPAAESSVSMDDSVQPSAKVFNCYKSYKKLTSSEKEEGDYYGIDKPLRLT